jgi:two-component system, OmpR family, alkaline phosphatase synthesis response regulator PhoP
MLKLKTALIADDDKLHIKQLTSILEMEGFEARLAIDTEHALHLLDKKGPELLFVTTDSPDYNFEQILSAAQSRFPSGLLKSIVFSEKEEEEIEVKAFEAGAHDFLKKPLRIKAFQKRLQRITNAYFINQSMRGLIKTRDFELNPSDYTVKYNNRITRLQERTFRLLYTFVEQPNNVFTREDLLKLVWDDNALVSERSVDVHILKIRQKLGNDLIKTIKGIGYKLDV